MILGLTGSIGSGKSFVGLCMEQLGARLIRADEIAREVIAPGTPGLLEIVRTFGAEVLDENGQVDRPKLARIVFSDPAKRRQLEEIIHPRVREREIRLLREHRGHPLIVLEIPLLFESRSEDLCDKILVVTIDEATRRERLMRDRAMTAQEIDARLASQMPQEEKVRRADYVIDNSGPRDATRRAVVALYSQLVPAP